MTSHTPLRVRFAPSPTGHVHLGSARTALYDYLIAKKTGGQFILRIEDTDRKRLVEGAEEELINSMRWLGIEWDEGPDRGGAYGPYRQSERKEIYLEYARKLIDLGSAYRCFCSPERLNQVRQEQQRLKLPPHYDGICRNLTNQEALERVKKGKQFVIRFKSSREGKTIVHDLLRGAIEFENKNLDDFILVKSDGWALYHLASIVDDYLMKITHVIRGSEWLPTSPLHALIWRAFGWEEPVWVHLSVFLKSSGKGKMSKREAAQLRDDGYSIFIKDLEDLGYLPEAVNNWIALMGWSYDDRTEFFSKSELIEKFSLEKLNPSPAAINFSKLDHFNQLHIKSLAKEDLSRRLIPFFQKEQIHVDQKKLELIIPAIKERLTTLDDAVELCRFLFAKDIIVIKDNLVVKELSAQQSKEIAEEVYALLNPLGEWKEGEMESTLKGLMQAKHLTPGQLYGFLREAISGQRVTPPLFASMVALDKEITLDRIARAISVLNE